MKLLPTANNERLCWSIALAAALMAGCGKKKSDSRPNCDQ
jgi:hypothetical protein